MVLRGLHWQCDYKQHLGSAVRSHPGMLCRFRLWCGYCQRATGSDNYGSSSVVERLSSARRRSASIMKKRILMAVLVLVAPCLGQAWSGILAPSRAIDWTKAGLPATFPDSETTTNPWTPPIRTQCGSTVASGASPATINAALAACSAGTYVLLGGTIASPATFTFSSINLTMYAQNGVTLRGSGPMATTLILTGTSQAIFSIGSSSYGFCTTWATGLSAGSTTLTATGCSGPAPTAGMGLYLGQCDSGYSGPIANPISSGTGCTAGGNLFDNGGLYVCAINNTYCSRNGTQTSSFSQIQAVYIQSVSTISGGYSFTVTPGIYMPNWGVTINSQYSTPYVYWFGGPTGGGGYSNLNYGGALEDFTLYDQTLSDHCAIDMTFTYASWVKGIRFIATANANSPRFICGGHRLHGLEMNNYSFGNVSLTSQYQQNFEPGSESDVLTLNNITESSVFWLGDGSMQGYVVAYNYNHNTFSGDTNGFFEHGPAGNFGLMEGNTVDSDEDDATNGSHDLNTRFREFIMGWQPPNSSPLHPSGLTYNVFARFENAIGNSIGYSGAPSGSALSTYQTTTIGVYNYVYSLNVNGAAGLTDALVQASLMRWGNWDAATGAARWCASSDPNFANPPCSGTSEIPTSLSGNASPFVNSNPASHTLPCSFFLTGYTATTCTPHPSGGTGLSWWKVCTSWTTFPTVCAAASTPPFPPIGPDVTGGPYNSGTAYDIPSVVAQKNLPIDTTFQQSFSIASSSYNAGTQTMTLTLSSGPSATTHMMGGFQISGGNCATSGAGTSTGAEEVITSVASVTSITYSLASNPGSCAGGTWLFPDVRQFDERVYETDPASGAAPTVPSGTMFSDWRFDDSISPGGIPLWLTAD